jgi:hypothetical protein
MNRNPKRGFFLAAIVGALFGAAAISHADNNNTTFSVEWDAAPAADGPVTYTVEKKPEGATSWTVVGETQNTVMTITGLNSTVQTMYRLKITNAEGNFVYDPNIVTDFPTADLGFRAKANTTAAANDSISGDSGAMLAAFKAAIAKPDPETPSFDLFEAFLASQARGETPFAPPAPERPETIAALFRDS